MTESETDKRACPHPYCHAVIETRLVPEGDVVQCICHACYVKKVDGVLELVSLRGEKPS